MDLRILISANRLLDGAVVWLSDQHQWVDELRDACAFDGARIEPAKLAASQAEALNHVVAPTPRPAKIVDGLPVPADYREVLRSRGPSVRTDLGKQAANREGQQPRGARPIVPVDVGHAGIYRSDASAREFLKNRAAQFGQQVERRLSGELNEEEFKVFRLMNGLYLQLHGYMLRTAVPYGTLSAIQLRQLAYIARN